MKLFIGIAVVFWLLCGIAGDWMLESDGDLHWKKVARGPVTLIQAFNEKPVSIPQP